MPTVPAVGVVITNFNNGSFVASAIESAASQTIRDIRVAVVDDASTDGSDEVIRDALARLNDPRFHYVRLETNVGQAGAIRRGLADLDAPFVCFLDSDDYWYPDFVAQHLAAHLNADFPVALSFCDSHIVDASGRMLAATAWWFDHNDRKPAHRLLDPARIPDIQGPSGEVTYSGKRPMILRTGWSPDSATNTTASMMLRRNFVDLVLVPADRFLPLYADYYLSTFAALLTGVIAIHDALYAYRMHGLNLHSNGEVFGGPYNSSTTDWDAIRIGVLERVRTTLRDEGPSIRRVFGDYQCDLAERLLTDAIEPRSWPKKARDRVRRLFR